MPFFFRTDRGFPEFDHGSALGIVIITRALAWRGAWKTGAAGPRAHGSGGLAGDPVGRRPGGFPLSEGPLSP
jgi:hypothetical protein